MIRILQNDRGSLTVGMLILLFVCGVFAFSFLKIFAYENELFSNHYNELQMFYKGEEALSRAVAEIRSNSVNFKENGTAYRDVIAPRSQEDFYKAEYTISGEDHDTVVARLFHKDDAENLDTLLLLRTVVRPKFSNEYFMLFDDPGAPYFLSGDLIDGKVHSNKSFQTAGTPVFTDIIECAVTEFEGFKQYGGYKGDPIFYKPIIWRSREYILQNQADRIRTRADRKFSNPNRVAEIHLKGKSFTLRYRSKDDPNLFTPAQSYPLSTLSSLYFEQDVEVRGILDGKLTIGSKENIYITDDLTYAGSHPVTGEPNAGSESILGLIAEKNVLINKDHRKVQQESGIKVNAAVIALDSSMATKNLYHQNMGTFHFWGSITEMIRGINAISRDDQILFGYAKNWHYDRRLSHMVPPQFTPIRSKGGNLEYKVISWNRKY